MISNLNGWLHENNLNREILFVPLMVWAEGKFNNFSERSFISFIGLLS